MKKKQIKRRKKIVPLILVFSLLINFSCNKEMESLEEISLRSMKIAAVEMKYDLTSTSVYSLQKGTRFTDMERALMTPVRTKQQVIMRIMENGDVYLEMENLKDEYEVKIKHQTPPDPTPVIHKTVFWRNTATAYDRRGKVLGEYNIEVPPQRDIIKKIKEEGMNYKPDQLSYAMLSLQGDLFIKDLEDLIKNPSKYDITVSYLDESTVGLRKAIKSPCKRELEVVLLIDRKNYKLMATRLYHKDDVLITSVYGYSNGKTPYLTSVKKIEKETLPSGKEVVLETLTQISDVELKINI